tara:strand:- start:3733 stop:3909 length:177 start_codon:yes stop_codon:yes gene_type:complete
LGWGAVAHTQTKTKKNRFGFWLLVLGAVFLGGLLLPQPPQKKQTNTYNTEKTDPPRVP